MSQHDEAIAAFHQGRSSDALRLLQPLLEAGETSELWNDWAAVQLALGDIERAEAGFSRAIELDPDNTDATINLGVLLLSRGDSTRALPLLTSVLPLLPASHRQTVNALLARNGGEPSSKPEDTTADGQHPRILVISDTFPDPASGGCDRQLLQILHAFRDLGAELTFAAREGVHSQACEPLLRQAGINSFSNDAEYMALLGYDVEASHWSLHGVLARAQFDVAILIQTFDRGISVPEQYLDELRQQAPAMRIAVFAPALYAASGGSGEADLVDFETAENWSTRQWEAFERADAVLVPSEDDAARLRECGRELQVEITHHLKAVSLASCDKQDPGPQAKALRRREAFRSGWWTLCFASACQERLETTGSYANSNAMRVSPNSCCGKASRRRPANN